MNINENKNIVQIFPNILQKHKKDGFSLFWKFLIIDVLWSTIWKGILGILE